MTRPSTLVVVAGTGTEVGKTWVACELAARLRGLGLTVSARKLAQSFSAAELGSTDAERHAAATGERAPDVCPVQRWYPLAMVPPMAAESMGAPPFALGDLLAELRWPPWTDVGLLEEAGGLGSPQASDADGVDLVEAVAPGSVVVVAGAGLGTLGDLRLAGRALSGWPMVVYLNHFDPADELHERNRRWLAERQGLVVAVNATEPARGVDVAKLVKRQGGRPRP